MLVPLPGLALSVGQARFDLALNAFCILVLLAACLFWALRALSGTAVFWALAVSALVLCDCRIAIYLNSFYQESGAYAGLVLLVCALPAFWEQPSALRLLAVGGAAAAIGLAKIAYTPAILPAMIPVAAAIATRRGEEPAVRRRILAVFAILLVLFTAFAIFPKDLFVRQNTYQFIFSGVVPHLRAEERGPFLIAIGLDARDASLSGDDAYTAGNRINEPDLRRLLTRRTQLRAALELLRHHPTSFLRLLRDGFSKAGIYPAYDRPSYENRREPEPRRWSAWSSLRASRFSGIPPYVASGVLWLGLLAAARRGNWPDEARFFLLASGGFLIASTLAVSVSILGNGPADVYKHSYLGNLLLDAAIVWIIAGLAAAASPAPKSTSTNSARGIPVQHPGHLPGANA